MNNSSLPSDPWDTLFTAHFSLRLAQWRMALERSGHSGAVIFSGNEQLRFRDDQAYPFTANPYFAGLVPLLTHPNCCIIVPPQGRPILLYWQAADYWFQPPAAPSGYWAEHFHVVPIADTTTLVKALPANKSGWISVSSSPGTDQWFDTVNPASVLREIDHQRAIKTNYELACMRRASDIGVRGHRAARAAFLSGASEFDIHQIYCQASGQTDTELPYSSIVALAPHGAVLHYQNLDRDINGAAALLLDAGGQHLGYASDITRTWTTDSDFQTLIDSVDRLQQNVCDEARAGYGFVDLNAFAHRQLAMLMVDHGLLKVGADEAFAKGITRTFLPHGLGHLLGLQVHDAGGHSGDIHGTENPPPPEHPWLRLTRPLAVGMVVTIEPGIYFIPSLLDTLRNSPAGQAVNWSRVEALRPFGGIRVEDNICITDGGHENLTRDAFRAVDDTI
jgi:Xaa-Pro dipeptidase